MESYDVIIVGAGPGGLKCAEILAKNKKKVLVLEKDPIFGDKVCAGGLTIKDLELGIPDGIIQRKFKSLTFKSPDKKTIIKQSNPFIATLDRKDLGKWMAENAKKQGAKILKNSRVIKITGKKVILSNGNEFEYKYLVGADGANSLVRNFLGLKNNNSLEGLQYIVPKKSKNLEWIVEPEKYGGLYLWIFPHKNTTAIGACVDITKDRKQPIFNLTVQDVKKNLTDFCKDRKINLKESRFQAFTINYDYQGHEFENKFLIGDAGGFASGLTGEGIYFAIKSGEDVANKIIDKKYKYPNIKRILKIKKTEEKLLRLAEVNKTLTRGLADVFALLLESKGFSKKAVNKI